MVIKKEKRDYPLWVVHIIKKQQQQKTLLAVFSIRNFVNNILDTGKK